MDKRTLKLKLQHLLLEVDERMCDLSDYVDGLQDDAPPLVNLEQASYEFDAATEAAIDYLRGGE